MQSLPVAELLPIAVIQSPRPPLRGGARRPPPSLHKRQHGPTPRRIATAHQMRAANDPVGGIRAGRPPPPTSKLVLGVPARGRR